MRVHVLLAAAAFAAPAFAQTSPQLADAQRAAWGRPGSTTYRLDNENVVYEGGRLLQTRFGPVLVAEGRVKDFGAPSPGRVGAFYLKRTPTGFARGRSYEAAVTGGGMGGIGEWGINTRLAANPVIYAEGGSTGQGITCSYTQLVELTPAGPVKLVQFQSYFGRDNGIDPKREITGRIANIVPGRSFDVVFTGNRAGRDRYVKRGARYVLAGRPTLDGC